MSKEFSHIDEAGKPAMVDVGAKTSTARRAIAECRLTIPDVVLEKFSGDEIHLAKGPVFQTAIIAGVMAAKKTSELIPLCHPLGLDNVQIKMEVVGHEIIITCHASVIAKTGVEMEAMTGASIAALTVYDMCKALSHQIIIRELKLVEKTGGKNDFRR
ncbi:MAG: cyclic pyranopterin monophosphate synthase MoaC [Flavobacteriales bacterium]|nr:cyclic pyranopterin monophosphate synthase MoaC [Flavobacteriales bacterium]